MGNDIAVIAAVLAGLEPVDRAIMLLERYESGVLERGAMLELFDGTDTPLPDDLREDGHA